MKLTLLSCIMMWKREYFSSREVYLWCYINSMGFFLLLSFVRDRFFGSVLFYPPLGCCCCWGGEGKTFCSRPVLPPPPFFALFFRYFSFLLFQSKKKRREKWKNEENFFFLALPSHSLKGIFIILIFIVTHSIRTKMLTFFFFLSPIQFSGSSSRELSTLNIIKLIFFLGGEAEKRFLEISFFFGKNKKNILFQDFSILASSTLCVTLVKCALLERSNSISSPKAVAVRSDLSKFT